MGAPVFELMERVPSIGLEPTHRKRMRRRRSSIHDEIAHA